MASTYLFHVKIFKAQYFARNLLLNDFLLEKSLDETEKVIVNLLTQLSLGNRPFSFDQHKVYSHGKPFIYDFANLYRMLYQICEITSQGELLSELEKWKITIKQSKDEFNSLCLLSMQILYRECQALVEEKKFDLLSKNLLQKGASPIKDYFLRICALYFIKQNQKDKARMITESILSPFDRSFVLGEITRQSFFKKDLDQAKKDIEMITEPHLKSCFLQMQLDLLR